ncbi:MAG TPA: ABC transporter permease, partial [Methylomirabilota bacterium]|nr:ABC transporter permease [Methylomirabilota bacterium]
MGSCAEIRKPERLVLALLRDTWQDVRYGARMMRKNPGFTAIATLTLALGIGANTAIFSLMSGVMLRFLPVKNPRELVQLRWTTGTHPRNVITSGYSGASFPFPVFEQLRFRSSSFSSVFAFANLGFDKPNISINAGGEPVMGRGEMVSGDYFSGLGVTPMQGRPLAEEDERPGAPLSAVVSYAFWTHRLARSSSAVGSAIKLNGVVFTICGVAPPEFFGLDQGRATDVWIPFLDRPELRPWSSPAPRGESLFLSHRWWWISVMGRLKPGVIPDQ